MLDNGREWLMDDYEINKEMYEKHKIVVSTYIYTNLLVVKSLPAGRTIMVLARGILLNLCVS